MFYLRKSLNNHICLPFMPHHLLDYFWISQKARWSIRNAFDFTFWPYHFVRGSSNSSDIWLLCQWLNASTIWSVIFWAPWQICSRWFGQKWYLIFTNIRRHCHRYTNYNKIMLLIQNTVCLYVASHMTKFKQPECFSPSCSCA